MRHAFTAILAAAATLIAVGMLGVASAEAPTTTPVRTVGVEGVGRAPIAQEADGEAAKASYRQAMATAIVDGQEKGQFLASHVGGTLGAVQSVVEESGNVECEDGEGNEGRYIQYLGVQPDFGSGRGAAGAPVEAAPEVSRSAQGVRAPTAAKKSKKKKKKAKKATAVSCTVTAGVALNYELG
jgi:cell division septation protein DedD